MKIRWKTYFSSRHVWTMTLNALLYLVIKVSKFGRWFMYPLYTVSLLVEFLLGYVLIIITNIETGPIWRCTSRGTFRDLTCAGLSFTIDGSLFGVGFGKLLTIWATENCELKTSLLHANFKQNEIEFVQFGQGNQCHLVAAASSTQLSVWNILTLTMSWVVRLPKVVLMVAEPQIPYIGVVCQTKKGANKCKFHLTGFCYLLMDFL